MPAAGQSNKRRRTRICLVGTRKMLFETPDPIAMEHKQRVARAIIDQEKPAHTYYDLEVEVPTMQIGVYSTVGVNTLLGTTTAEGPDPSP